jgi:hypothetical protein
VVACILIMKDIIHGMGALMTWTIIPGTGVQIFLVGYYPIIRGHFGCIPRGGHLGYYPSTEGQQSTVEAVEDLRRDGMSPG